MNNFLRNIDNIDAVKNIRDDSSTSMLPLPIKDQQSSNYAKKQMQILNANIGVQIKPVFQTKKMGQILAPKETKPPYCQYSMRGLQTVWSVRSVRRRLCRVHRPTFTPAL